VRFSLYLWSRCHNFSGRRRNISNICIHHCPSYKDQVDKNGGNNWRDSRALLIDRSERNQHDQLGSDPKGIRGNHPQNGRRSSQHRSVGVLLISAIVVSYTSPHSGGPTTRSIEGATDVRPRAPHICHLSRKGKTRNSWATWNWNPTLMLSSLFAKLMVLLRYTECRYGSRSSDGFYETRRCPIAWSSDGNFIIVRQKEVVLCHILPLFGLRISKFHSLVR
jgi:hypothetical protein